MAADSDGDLIETVVTCEGDLGDPDFPRKFQVIVNRLSSLVCKGKRKCLFYFFNQRNLLFIFYTDFLYRESLLTNSYDDRK